MAITKETFRTLIHEGHEEIRDVVLYDRPFDFEQNGRYVLVGVRQAGKSYMLYKRARQIIASGYQLEDMVYINFNDERLIGMTANELDYILQAYQSIYNRTPVLFFDEIQNVEGWEHFARRLANKKYQVYITGSNARMLSRDIHTVLGGRYLDVLIYPYTFLEYLEATGITLDADLKTALPQWNNCNCLSGPPAVGSPIWLDDSTKYFYYKEIGNKFDEEKQEYKRLKEGDTLLDLKKLS